MSDTPTWLVTVRAPQGGPVYTHTADGGDVNQLLATMVLGLDLADADAVLITATCDGRGVLPLPDDAVDRALATAEETGLSAAPQIVRRFLSGSTRAAFEDQLRHAMRRVLREALR